MYSCYGPSGIAWPALGGLAGQPFCELQGLGLALPGADETDHARGFLLPFFKPSSVHRHPLTVTRDQDLADRTNFGRHDQSPIGTPVAEDIHASLEDAEIRAEHERLAPFEALARLVIMRRAALGLSACALCSGSNRGRPWPTRSASGS